MNEWILFLSVLLAVIIGFRTFFKGQIISIAVALLIVATAVGCTFTDSPPTITAGTELAESAAPTESAKPTETSSPTQPTETTASPQLTDPVAIATNGTVHSYPLDIIGGQSLCLMGENYLLYSSSGTSRMMTILSGEDLRILAQRELPESISTYAADECRILYYAPESHCCVFLDETLQETKRIALPGTLAGSADEVLFTQDMRMVYYPVPGYIEGFDLELAQTRQSFQSPGTLRALCFAGTDAMIMCHTEHPTGAVFISTTWGHEVARDASWLGIDTFGSHFFIHRFIDRRTEYLYGSLNGELQTFSPPSSGQLFVMPQLTGVIIADNAAPVHLEYYDLASGKRTSILDFPGNASIPYRGYTVSADSRYICFLGLDQDGQTTLYRWELALSPSGDDTVYLTSR